LKRQKQIRLTRFKSDFVHKISELYLNYLIESCVEVMKKKSNHMFCEFLISVVCRKAILTLTWRCSIFLFNALYLWNNYLKENTLVKVILFLYQNLKPNLFSALMSTDHTDYSHFLITLKLNW